MSFLSRLELAARDPHHEDHEAAKSYLARRDHRGKQRARMGIPAGTAGAFRKDGNTLILDMLPASAPPVNRGSFS
jgi:hypothetical protein